MALPKDDRHCAICYTIDEFYKASLLKTDLYRDKFYATLTLKTFKRGEKTPILSNQIRETHMNYCPYCGKPIKMRRKCKLKRNENGEIIDE